MSERINVVKLKVLFYMRYFVFIYKLIVMTELLNYSWQRFVSASNFMFRVKKHHLKQNIEKKSENF